VHHEGELTLVELLDKITQNSSQIEYADIEGIAYRKPDGEVQVNPRRPYILDLDCLPHPARDMIDMENYLMYWREHNGYASLTINLARGCPYNCQWCQDSVHGPDFRIRSPQNVAAEVKNLTEEFNFDRLRVVDDVDGIDREWIEEWARHSKMEGVDMPFEALSDLKRKDIPMLDVRDTL
jgi:anaerobic magnesium-protoporphyrin IX monomethyl ester cyclase